ncbi:hypothetical protein U1Q18_031895, partial [Sarracenia purpurea var. burkii]
EDDKVWNGGGAVGGVQRGDGKGEGTTIAATAYANSSSVSESSPFCLHFTHHCP